VIQYGTKVGSCGGACSTTSDSGYLHGTFGRKRGFAYMINFSKGMEMDSSKSYGQE
jgi:hypothetical protein